MLHSPRAVMQRTARSVALKSNATTAMDYFDEHATTTLDPKGIQKQRPTTTTTMMPLSSSSSSSSMALSSLPQKWRYHWTRLTTRGKVASLVVVLYLLQYIVFGLVDHWFHQYGTLPYIHRHQLNKNNNKTKLVVMEAQEEKSFAVAINTYKRPDMLRLAVQHYAETCGRQAGVSQVFVIWAEQNSPQVPTPESLFSSTSSSLTQPQESLRQPPNIKNKNRAQVIVLQKDKDSLNSRFEPMDGLTSKAIFMVDDDIQVACPSLRLAFDAWKAHPESMVGFYPRLATISHKTDFRKTRMAYHTWPFVYWKQEFNFVLTKACFLHAKYLALYTSAESSIQRKVRDHVDQHRNCEDIAMSLLVANVTRHQQQHEHLPPAPPVYVEGSISDQGLFHGISTGTGHMATRSECLTELTFLYEQAGWGNPVLASTRSLRSYSWVRHAPGFWWQSRPSNIFEWLSFPNPYG